MTLTICSYSLSVIIVKDQRIFMKNFCLLQCYFPSSLKENEYNLKLHYVLTQTFSISIVRQGQGGTYNHANMSKDLVFQLFFYKGGGHLDMYRPKHIMFNGWGQWELEYALTQTFSFSIVRQGRGNLAIRGYIETFGGVGTAICMDPNIQFFNCVGAWDC